MSDFEAAKQGEVARLVHEAKENMRDEVRRPSGLGDAGHPASFAAIATLSCCNSEVARHSRVSFHRFFVVLGLVVFVVGVVVVVVASAFASSYST